MTVIYDLPLRVLDSAEEMGAAAAEHVVKSLRTALETKGRARLMLAAAPSQFTTLQALAQSDIDFSRVDCFHMDDYIGLDPHAPQGFGNWLQRNFVDRITEPPTFHRIDPSRAPQEAAAGYAEALGEDAFDVTMCGLGVNAHLAFNDPPADFTTTDAVRLVELDVRSRQQQVDEGLFATLGDVPLRALTVTIPRLLHAETVVCIVPGALKRDAVMATVRSKPDPQIPGTALKMHRDATIYADTKAAP